MLLDMLLELTYLKKSESKEQTQPTNFDVFSSLSNLKRIMVCIKVIAFVLISRS